MSKRGRMRANTPPTPPAQSAPPPAVDVFEEAKKIAAPPADAAPEHEPVQEIRTEPEGKPDAPPPPAVDVQEKEEGWGGNDGAGNDESAPPTPPAQSAPPSLSPNKGSVPQRPVAGKRPNAEIPPFANMNVAPTDEQKKAAEEAERLRMEFEESQKPELLPASGFSWYVARRDTGAGKYRKNGKYLLPDGQPAALFRKVDR